MKPETKLKTWLDHARAGTNAELRKATQLWVVVQKPLLQREILNDLEPIPETHPDHARRDLEGMIEKHLADQEAQYLVRFSDDGRLGIEVDHWYNDNDALDKAWHDFFDYLQYNQRSNWRVCQHCGSAFEVKKGVPKYCSESCRSMAYRKRKSEKEKT